MPPPPPAIPPAKRRKNTNRGRGGAVGAAAASADELVKLGPEVARGSERLRTGWRAVQLSAEDKAAEVALNDRQMCASSSAGYRMVRGGGGCCHQHAAALASWGRSSRASQAAAAVPSMPQAPGFCRVSRVQVRATHGVYSGTWYYEVRVDKLGPSGAVRCSACGAGRRAFASPGRLMYICASAPLIRHGLPRGVPRSGGCLPPACRLGWATRQAEINAPVGADKHGYSYRSAQGSKVRRRDAVRCPVVRTRGDQIAAGRLPAGCRRTAAAAGGRSAAARASIFSVICRKLP